MTETTITLLYCLSTSAQRVELASGRPAHAERRLDLTPDEELATLATITPGGVATIDYRTSPVEYSHVTGMRLLDRAAGVDAHAGSPLDGSSRRDRR